MTEENKLLKDFKIKGIAASEFDHVRGTMCTKDEFGGWGSQVSDRPYALVDGSSRMAVRSEKMAFAEAAEIRDRELCIHGNVGHLCPYKRPEDPTCRVRV